MATQKKVAAEIDPRTAKSEAKASKVNTDYSTASPICQVEFSTNGENPSIEELEQFLNEAIIRRYERMQAEAQEAKAQALQAAQAALSVIETAQQQAQEAVAKAQSRVAEQKAKIHSCEVAISASEARLNELITRAQMAGLEQDMELGQAIVTAVDCEIKGIERSIRGHKLAKANAEKALVEAQEALEAAQANQAQLSSIIELARQGREAEALDQVDTDEELEMVRLIVEARARYHQAQTFRDTMPAEVQAHLQGVEAAQAALAEAEELLEQGDLFRAHSAFQKVKTSCADEEQLQTLRGKLAQAWAREVQRLACRERIGQARKALERARELGATDAWMREAEGKITLHDLRHRARCVDTSSPKEATRRLDALQEEAEEMGMLPAVISVINQRHKVVAARQRELNFLWAQTRRHLRRLASNPEPDVSAYSSYGPGKILAWSSLGKKYQAIRTYQWLDGRRDGRWVDGPPARRIIADTLPRGAMVVRVQ